MAKYGEWDIGGHTPSHIESVDYDFNKRQITLHCVAFADETGEDPRLEIQTFDDMACDVVSNTQLQGGGSSLQICNGDLTIATDGVLSWVAALEHPTMTEDSYAEGSIAYDMVLDIETLPRGGVPNVAQPLPPDNTDVITPVTTPVPSFTYNQGLQNYSNIEYYQFTNKDQFYSADNFYGSAFGWMKITEVSLVRQVQITGVTDYLPAWVDVNGVRLIWNVVGPNYDSAARTGHVQGDPWVSETLTFDLPTPSMELTIQTSNYIWEPDGTNTAANKHGTHIGTIKVVYK